MSVPVRTLAPLWAGALASLLIPILAAADDAALTRQYDEQIKPLLAKHCFECHATEKPKGDLRLDKLTLDFADNANREVWATALERIKTGEMPPKEKPRLSAAESRALLEWIRGQVEPAETAARAAQGRVVLRRLNRVEYENTIRDLLAVEVDLTELLPEDCSADGFDNVGDGAAHVVVPDGEVPGSGRQGAERRDRQPAAAAAGQEAVQPQGRAASSRRRPRASICKRDDALVMFSSSAWNAITRRPVLSAGPRPVSLPHLGLRPSRAAASRSPFASMPARC